MNLPNYITLLRIVLIPFFINFMIYGYNREALAVFLAASLTDALDGMIARMTGKKTELGAFLDPIADKLLIVSAFVTLVLLGMQPVWLVIVVVSRDIILVLGSIVLYIGGDEFHSRPTLVGKIATFLQFAVVVLSLLPNTYHKTAGWIVILQITTACFTVASGVQYFARGIRIVEHKAE